MNPFTELNLAVGAEQEARAAFAAVFGDKAPTITLDANTPGGPLVRIGGRAFVRPDVFEGKTRWVFGLLADEPGGANTAIDDDMDSAFDAVASAAHFWFNVLFDGHFYPKDTP